MSRDVRPPAARLGEAEPSLAAEAAAEIAELVGGATVLAPLISPPPWEPAPTAGPLPAPRLSYEAPADRAAWIQLGVTIEAIDVAGSENGLGFTVDPDAGDPPLAVVARSTSTSMAAHRLAGCLRTPAGSFRDAPLRLAAHTSARLASAAALHGCTLTWLDAPGVLADLSAALPAPLPAGASAVGVIATPRDDRGGLMRGGRAACRVWLEAVSLGLAVQPLPELPALGAARLAALDVHVDGVLVAALAFGASG